MKRRIAISGGDSPVGRALAKVLDARSIGYRILLGSKPASALSPQGEYLVGDETDSAKVEWLLVQAEALVHLGRVDVSPSDDFCQGELAGQATLIPAAQERSIELHFLSSAEVFTPSPDAVDEQAPVAPSSPLGVAKVAWEQTLRIWREHKGLQYVVYRVPTVVAEYLSYGNTCARYLRQGFKSGNIRPQAYRGERWGLSYIHAEDVATVIADTIGRRDAWGETFHLSADRWISEIDLAEMSYRVLNDFMIPCKWTPPTPDVPTELVGDVWLDNRKAKQRLGLSVENSISRLARKLRLWVDDFGSTARLPGAK